MSETTTFKSPASPVNNSATPAQPEVPPSTPEQSPAVNGTPAEESLPTTEIIVTDKDTPTPKDPEANKNASKEDVASESKNEEPSSDINTGITTSGSTPAKVSASETSDEHSSKKYSKKSNNMKVIVQLLDGSKYDIEITKQTLGQFMFEKITDYLNLVESDYFGITYVEKENEEIRYWLNLEKKVSKQIKEKNLPWEFAFQVKFYPPDPAQLQEDLTRYMLCLQIRIDILNEKLPCSFVTHALLGSYTVQSELGDYDSTEHGQGIDYIKDFKFAPNQDTELLQNIATLHRQHKGQTPEEAELHFLENAKKLAMYGVDLHEAMDSNNVDILLGVCASGLLVYKDKLRINRFSWPKILKISYKGKAFVIKIRPGEFERYENVISFKLAHHRLAKRLWKTCVEHHTFFRLKEPDSTKPAHVFPRFGSRFRYSGRTQYQTQLSTIDRQAPHFARAGKYSQSSYSYDRSRSMDDGNATSNVDPAAVNNRDRLPSTDSFVSAGGYPAIATLPRLDGKDRHDKIRGVPTPLANLGMQNRYGDSEDGRFVSAPNVNDAERLERTGSPDSAKTMEFSGEYDATALESPTAIVAVKKPASDKEEKKKEKERKKREEEERKKREKEEKEREKERKKREKELAKEKAKEKKDEEEARERDKLKNSEDRLDKMGHDDSALNMEGTQPLSDSQMEGNILIAPGWQIHDEQANINGTSSPTPEELAAAAEKEHKAKEKEKRGGLFSKFKKHPKDSKDKRDMADGNVVPAVQVNNVPDEATMANKSEAAFTNGPDITQEKKEDTVTTEIIIKESETSKKDHKKKSGHRSSGLLCPMRNPFKKKPDKRKSTASESSDEDKEGKGDKVTPGALNGQAGREPVKRTGSASSSSSEGQDEYVTSTEAKDGYIDGTPLTTIISEKPEPVEGATSEAQDGLAEPPLPPVVIDEKEPVEGATLGSENKLDELPLPPVIAEEKEPVEGTTPEALSNLSEPPLPPVIVEEKEPLEKATEDLVRQGPPAGIYGGVPVGGQPEYNGELYPGGIANAGTPEEQWIDNKMSFMPVIKPEKTTRSGYEKQGAPLRPAKPPTAEKPRKKPPPVPPKFSSRSPADQLDMHLHEDGDKNSPIPPTVETETIKFNPDLTETPISTKNVPIVKTETRKVSYQKDGLDGHRESEEGVLVSSQAHSSKTQTIETTTYRTEKDGIVETRVERKVTITSDNDDIDHDAALAEAIRSVTEMNPDLSVERIEYMQEIE